MDLMSSRVGILSMCGLFRLLSMLCFNVLRKELYCVHYTWRLFKGKVEQSLQAWPQVTEGVSFCTYKSGFFAFVMQTKPRQSWKVKACAIILLRSSAMSSWNTLAMRVQLTQIKHPGQPLLHRRTSEEPIVSSSRRRSVQLVFCFV